MTLHGPSGGTESDLSPGVEAILNDRSELPSDPNIGQIYYLKDERRAIVCTDESPGALVWVALDPVAELLTVFDEHKDYLVGSIVATQNPDSSLSLWLAETSVSGIKPGKPNPKGPTAHLPGVSVDWSPVGGTTSPGVEAVVDTRSALPTGPKVGQVYYITDEQRAVVCVDEAPVWKSLDPTAGGFVVYEPTVTYPAGQIVSQDDGYGGFLLFMATKSIAAGQEPGTLGTDWAPLAALPTDYNIQGHLFRTPEEVPTDDPNDVPDLVGKIQGQYLVLHDSVWHWNEDLLLSVAVREPNATGMPTKMVATKADFPTTHGDGSALVLGDYTIVTSEHTAYLYTGIVGLLWAPLPNPGTYKEDANAQMWVKDFDFSGSGVVTVYDSLGSPTTPLPDPATSGEFLVDTHFPAIVRFKGPDGKWQGIDFDPTDIEGTFSDRIDALILGLEHGEAVHGIIPMPVPGIAADELWIVDPHPEAMATDPTGNPNPFIGHANELALFDGGSWVFSAPEVGEAHLVEDRKATYVWNETKSIWVKVAGKTAFYVYATLLDFGDALPPTGNLKAGDLFFIEATNQMGHYVGGGVANTTALMPPIPQGPESIGKVLRLGARGLSEWGFEHRFVTPTECPSGDPNDVVPPLPATENEWVTTDSSAWRYVTAAHTYGHHFVDPKLGATGAWTGEPDFPLSYRGGTIFRGVGDWLEFGGHLWVVKREHGHYSWFDTGVPYVAPHWAKEYDFKSSGGEHLFLGPEILPSRDPNDFLPIPNIQKGDHLVTDKAVWFWNTEPILAARYAEGATGETLGTIETAADLPAHRSGGNPLGDGDIVYAKDTGYAHIFENGSWSESSVPYTAANSAMWVKEFDFAGGTGGSSDIFYETDAAFAAARASAAWSPQPDGTRAFTRQHVWEFNEAAATWNQVLEFAPTIFFGSGPLTAITAPRYGMPAGTTPDPETHSPQTGDVYFDSASGVAYKFTGTAGSGSAVVSAASVPSVVTFYDSKGLASTPYPDPATSGDLLVDTDAMKLVAYKDGGVWQDFDTSAAAAPSSGTTIEPHDITHVYETGDLVLVPNPLGPDWEWKLFRAGQHIPPGPTPLTTGADTHWEIVGEHILHYPTDAAFAAARAAADWIVDQPKGTLAYTREGIWEADPGSAAVVAHVGNVVDTVTRDAASDPSWAVLGIGAEYDWDPFLAFATGTTGPATTLPAGRIVVHAGWFEHIGGADNHAPSPGMAAWVSISDGTHMISLSGTSDTIAHMHHMTDDAGRLGGLDLNMGSALRIDRHSVMEPLITFNLGARHDRTLQLIVSATGVAVVGHTAGDTYPDAWISTPVPAGIPLLNHATGLPAGAEVWKKVVSYT